MLGITRDFSSSIEAGGWNELSYQPITMTGINNLISSGNIPPEVMMPPSSSDTGLHSFTGTRYTYNAINTLQFQSW